MCKCKPIIVAALSEARTVSARSNTGIMNSNPTRGMNVCVPILRVCVVLFVGSGLVQGVLHILYRIKKLKKRPRSEGL
jgi:hypothetical protein